MTVPWNRSPLSSSVTLDYDSSAGSARPKPKRALMKKRSMRMPVLENRTLVVNIGEKPSNLPRPELITTTKPRPQKIRVLKAAKLLVPGSTRELRRGRSIEELKKRQNPSTGTGPTMGPNNPGQPLSNNAVPVARLPPSRPMLAPIMGSPSSPIATPLMPQHSSPPMVYTQNNGAQYTRSLSQDGSQQRPVAPQYTRNPSLSSLAMPSEHEVKTRAEQLKYFADYFLDADEDLRKDSDDDDPKEKQLNILFTYPPAPPLDIHDPMWFVNMLRAFREEREQMQYRMQGLRDMAFEALVEADIAEAEMHAERVQLKLLMDRIARLAGKAFVDMVLQRKADGEGAASGLSDMETDPLPATPLKSPSQTMPPPPVPQQDGRGRMQSRPTTPKRQRIRSTSRDSADDLADDERSHKRSRLFDPSPSPPPSPGPVDNASPSPGGIVHVLSPNPADSSPSPIKERVPPPGLKKRKNCPSRGKIGDMKGTRFHNGTTNLKAVFDKKRASLGKKLQDQPPHMPKRHVPLPGAPVARMSVGLPYANPAFFDPRTGMPYPAIASALRNAGLPNEGVVGTPQGGTSQSTATGIVQNMALPYINTAVYNPSSFASGSQTQQSPQTHPRSPSGSAGPSSPPVLARNNALPRRPPVRREHTVVYCFAPEAAIEAGAGAKVQEPQEGPQAAAAAAQGSAQVAPAGPVRLLEVEASTPPQRVSPKDRWESEKTKDLIDEEDIFNTPARS